MAALILCGCAISEQEARRLAARDVAAHHVPVPPGTQIEASDERILVFNELIGSGEEYPRYVITYSYRGKPLYEVSIRKYTPYIREFKDLRIYSAPFTPKSP